MLTKNPHHPILTCSPAERFSKWGRGEKPRRGSRGYGHQWRIQEILTRGGGGHKMEWVQINDEVTARGFNDEGRSDRVGGSGRGF